MFSSKKVKDEKDDLVFPERMEREEMKRIEEEVEVERIDSNEEDTEEEVEPPMEDDFDFGCKIEPPEDVFVELKPSSTIEHAEQRNVMKKSQQSVKCVKSIPGNYATIYEISVTDGFFLYTTQDKEIRLFQTNGDHVKTLKYSGSVKSGAIFGNYTITTCSGECLIYEIPSLSLFRQFTLCRGGKWFDDLIVMKSYEETFIACCYAWSRESDDEPQGIIYQCDNFTSRKPNIEIIYQQHDPIRKAHELVKPQSSGPRIVFTGSLTRTVKNQAGHHEREGDFRVMLLNIENPGNIQTFGQLHTKEIMSITSFINKNEEEYVVSGDRKNVVGIWNSSNASLVRQFNVGASVYGQIGYLFNFDRMIFIGQDGCLLCLFTDQQFENNEEEGSGQPFILDENQHKSKITSIKVLEDGNIVTSDYSKNVHIWRVTDMDIIERMNVSEVKKRNQSIERRSAPQPNSRNICLGQNQSVKTKPKKQRIKGPIKLKKKKMMRRSFLEDEYERMKSENEQLKRKVEKLKDILREVDDGRLKQFEREEEM